MALTSHAPAALARGGAGWQEETMRQGSDLSEAMRRYGGPAEAWLDLSAGINPWPWPIPADLPASIWQRLPTRADEEALLAAARAVYQPGRADIVPSPGTQVLIQWLPRLAAPGPVAIVGPTWGEHARAWRAAGHEVLELEGLEKLPSEARHAVVVNPSDLDGSVIDRTAVVRAAQRLRGRGGWLVVDETFADLDRKPGCAAWCADFPLVVLRSFGEFYGLAGIRLGFAIAARDICASLSAALGSWPLSGPALLIGRQALGDSGWARQIRPRLQAQAEQLDGVLMQAGFSVVGGTALFRLAQHRKASAIHEQLAHQRIWSRSFEHAPDLLQFGLPGDAAGLERLAAAFAVFIRPAASA